MMKPSEIRTRLETTFGSAAVLAATDFRGETTVTIAPGQLLEVGRFLRDAPEISLDFLSFVAGVDRYPERPRFEVVYQLYSTKYRHRFRVKAYIDETAEAPPIIDSVVGIWPTANWHERETAEMFGIVFRGHPDLRKLLLPEEWTVHPLRKDFPLEGTEETADLPRRA